MRPHLKLLSDDLINQIISEGLVVLQDPGVRVRHAQASNLLACAGAAVDSRAQVARIPEEIASTTSRTVPSEFHLYDPDGEPGVRYSSERVQFGPGSMGTAVLHTETQEERTPVPTDSVKFVRLVKTLSRLVAQSTAFVSTDVPGETGDLGGLHVAADYVRAPIDTGVFCRDTW